MKRPAVSIAALMAGVGLIAVGSASLRNASPLWASALFTLDLILVAASLVLALVRPPTARGFWVGSAVFGGLYLAATFGPWPGRAGVNAPPLVTRVLVDLSADLVHQTEERVTVDGADDGEHLDPPGFALEYRGPGAFLILGTRVDGRRDSLPAMSVPAAGHKGATIVDAHQYRRVGHSLLALAANGLGGLLGLLGSRWARRDAQGPGRP